MGGAKKKRGEPDPESKEVLKNQKNESMSEGQRSQPKRATNGQNHNNLSNKTVYCIITQCIK